MSRIASDEKTSIFDFAGFIKSKKKAKKFDAEKEFDKVVYGI